MKPSSEIGELSGEDEADGGLDLAGGHGLALVVLAKASGLAGDPLEGVGHEGVQDAHGSLGDSGVGVDLLEDAVDVDVVGLAGLFPPGAGAGSCWSSSGHVYLVFL